MRALEIKELRKQNLRAFNVSHLLSFRVSLFNPMRQLMAILVLLVAFAPVAAHAKRKAPPKVEPVVFEGIRYTVPNDNGRRAYVQAWNTTTNRMLWEVTIFRNFIVPLAEEDVQHVYINKMSISHGKLILVAEDGRTYSLNVKTRAVTKVKSAPPVKAEANPPAGGKARLVLQLALERPRPRAAQAGRQPQ